MSANTNRFNEIHNRLEELKKEIGYCPLCGKKFDESENEL